DAAAVGEVGAVAGESAGFDGDVRPFEGQLDLRAQRQRGRGSEARGTGPEGEGAREHARTPLVEPSSHVRQLEVERDALMVELELPARHDEPPDLHLAPRPAEREARAVGPTLREGVHGDSWALDDH